MFCVGSNPPETNAKPPTLFSFSSPFKRLKPRRFWESRIVSQDVNALALQSYSGKDKSLGVLAPRVERWRIYDVVDILENIGILSLSSEKRRRFEKGFWYLEYLQHVFESRGFQFSDSDHAIDGNHSSGDSNEAGTKLGVHNSGSPETVDLVFYMDKIEKACDLRDIVLKLKQMLVRRFDIVDKGIKTKSLEDRSKVGDSELCNDLKTNRDVEESSREDFADAEGFRLLPNSIKSI
ncbi:hypothetical protein DY000_02049924 [Brassica cretica]|uniref:E2F/DP family winged-helix DNA-binding domain-containing protein n=1 Tax=Brassica cretica TaxID=69181 RepID=A0ABQ7EUM6_BRACR|nr:hypothetical protein DY000_02049924 [Brassica cretica]